MTCAVPSFGLIDPEVGGPTWPDRLPSPLLYKDLVISRSYNLNLNKLLVPRFSGEQKRAPATVNLGRRNSTGSGGTSPCEAGVP